MTEKLSQREVVVKKMEAEGEVSNVWAVNNYIYRLSVIVNKLRHNDNPALEWDIRTEMRGDNKKSCFYVLVKKPE